MPKKRHSVEEIFTKLREAWVIQPKGQTLSKVCTALGITRQTDDRWRKELGGLEVDQAKRLKQLETVNARLKKVVADQALDMAILKEAAEGNS